MGEAYCYLVGRFRFALNKKSCAVEQHQKDVYGEAFFKEYNSSVSSTPVTIASDPQVTVDAMLYAVAIKLRLRVLITPA